MSLPKKMTVRCSECGAEIEVMIFDSVNTDYSPDIAEQIISGDLFIAKCSKCGFEFPLEYEVLYHDIKHGAMIWVLNENSPGYGDRVYGLRNSANVLGYKTMRIVNDMDGLREKVACLKNGRDDRVVELCKAFIKLDLLSQQPDFDFNKAFYTTCMGKELVFVYDKNGRELSCELTENVYSLLCDMYYNSDYLNKFEGYYALVDYKWAERIVEPLLNQESERISSQNDVTPTNLIESTTDKEKALCPKCKQSLPEDSEFCQYCGTKIMIGSPLTEVENDEAFVDNVPKVTSVEHYKRHEDKGVKIKYCSKCGSKIDNCTKVCTGCGKQYFKGIKFNKFFVITIVLSLIIVLISALCISQYSKRQKSNDENQIVIENLESRISELEQQLSNKESTIGNLQRKIDDLESKKYENWSKIYFFESYAEIVGDDGTNKYHKWGCSKLDTSDGFWIFNTEAAISRGYKSCSYCH